MENVPGCATSDMMSCRNSIRTWRLKVHIDGSVAENLIVPRLSRAARLAVPIVQAETSAIYRRWDTMCRVPYIRWISIDIRLQPCANSKGRRADLKPAPRSGAMKAGDRFRHAISRAVRPGFPSQFRIGAGVTVKLDGSGKTCAGAP